MPRGIPTTRLGVLMILGAALAPVIAKKLRPAAKSLGKGMIKLGKKIRDSAEEPHRGPKTSRS